MTDDNPDLIYHQKLMDDYTHLKEKYITLKRYYNHWVDKANASELKNKDLLEQIKELKGRIKEKNIEIHQLKQPKT